MHAAARPTLRERFLGVGLQTRMVVGAAVLVLSCGGFLAYRSVSAIADAYRWTAEAEAAAIAHGFARSLHRRDLHDVERIRAHALRLHGVHPDLTGVAVVPAAAGAPELADYSVREDGALLTFPIIDG